MRKDLTDVKLAILTWFLLLTTRIFYVVLQINFINFFAVSIFVILSNLMVLMLMRCSPFEPPKPKTKHRLGIESAEDYMQLYAQEQQ